MLRECREEYQIVYRKAVKSQNKIEGKGIVNAEVRWI